MQPHIIVTTVRQGPYTAVLSRAAFQGSLYGRSMAASAFHVPWTATLPSRTSTPGTAAGAAAISAFGWTSSAVDALSAVPAVCGPSELASSPACPAGATREAGATGHGSSPLVVLPQLLRG